MIPDALVAGIIRDMSRRYLSFGDSAASARLPEPNADRRYMLYLHVPFCVVLCPFCSFHRVEFKESRARSYFEALRSEIRTATESGFRFNEIYFGGGTPTVLPDELIETIAMVRNLHRIDRLSIETNPDDLGSAGLFRLREAGVNRVSVGVQSFDDSLLREMQRLEKYGDGKQIRQRLNAAKGMFETLNVDMIFNLPHQSESSLRTDLKILTDDVAADQVSFYPLMTTGSTRIAMKRAMGDADYGREKAYYRLISEHMLAAGYQRASAWCFSRRPDMIDEYITEQDEYLGIGSGAFSFLQGSIYASTFSINHYIRLAAAGESGIARQRTLDRVDHMRYYLLTRLFSGSLDLRQADANFSGDFRRTLRKELTGLRLLGAARASGDILHLTERGFYLWVIMMREFFTGVNQLREEMRHDIANEVRLSTIAGEHRQRQCATSGTAPDSRANSSEEHDDVRENR